MTLATNPTIDDSHASAGTDRSGSLTIPSLNGIRAVSVLIVVLSHSGFGKIVPGGLGVTIFFFLSGYLISSLMLSEHERNGQIDISRFYARRAFRLIPPLVITLAIAYGLVYFDLLPGVFTFKSLFAQLFYFDNYYEIFFDQAGTTPAGTGILWSLAVEEHFYIVYPFVLILLLANRASPRSIGIVLTVLCLIILAWRIYLVTGGAPEYRTYYASDTRMDSIVYGCLMAAFIKPMPVRALPDRMSVTQWATLGFAFCCLSVTLIYRNSLFRETFRYSVQGIALIPIFVFAIRFHANSFFRHLNSRWMVMLGDYSYFIYLIHFVIINLLTGIGPSSWHKSYVLFPAALSLSIFYAVLIDRFVDPYFRELRQRLQPSARSGSADTTPKGQALG